MQLHRYILVFILLLKITLSNGQDIHFSNAFYSPQEINPAFTGIFYTHEANLIYKDQWRSVTNPYKTIYGGYNIRINEKKSWNGFLAAGLSFFSDRAGDANMGFLSAKASVVYHAIISRNLKISGGIQPMYTQHSVNFNSLRWGSQFDGYKYNSSASANEEGYKENVNMFDINSGVAVSYKKPEKRLNSNDFLSLCAGYSVYNALRSRESYYKTGQSRIYIRQVLSIMGFVGIPHTRFSLMPEFMFSSQGPYNELLFGTSVRLKMNAAAARIDEIKGKAFALGLFYRNNDALIARMLYQYSNFDFGFSYDINISPLKKASGYSGGAEIFIRWVAPDPFVNNVVRF